MDEQITRLFKILGDAVEQGVDNIPQMAQDILVAYANYAMLVATALFIISIPFVLLAVLFCFFEWLFFWENHSLAGLGITIGSISFVLALVLSGIGAGWLVIAFEPLGSILASKL